MPELLSVGDWLLFRNIWVPIHYVLLLSSTGSKRARFFTQTLKIIFIIATADTNSDGFLFLCLAAPATLYRLILNYLLTTQAAISYPFRGGKQYTIIKPLQR